MSVPVDVFVEVGEVLIKHGVTHYHQDDMNNLIKALTPMFEPGYVERVKEGKRYG